MVRGAAGRAVAGLLARLVVPRRAVAGRCGLVVAGLALRRVTGLAVPGLVVGRLAVRGLALRRVAGLAVTGLIVGRLALLLVTGLGLLGLAGAALRTLPGRTDLGSAVCAERHVVGHAGLTPRTDHLLTSKPLGHHSIELPRSVIKACPGAGCRNFRRRHRRTEVAFRSSRRQDFAPGPGEGPLPPWWAPGWGCRTWNRTSRWAASRCRSWGRPSRSA